MTTRPGSTSLRAVVRSAIELTSRHDRDAVLDAILIELERLVPYDMAAVLVREGEGLRWVAGRGFRRDAPLAGRRFEGGENPRLDRALEARGTVHFTDPTQADPFDGLSARALDHLHSCMAAPMRVEGKTIGVITADAHARGRFDEGHAEQLELFAALAAVAIQNADLVSELQHTRARLQSAVSTLDADLQSATGGGELVGESMSMRALRDEIGLVGSTDTAVLVLGETGTGKELVARALHAASARRGRPLIRFDAAAVAPTLIEAALFGHARGAFTGAIQAQPGRFEVADGSTLFLDEIGELPLELQPRLLRVLQTGEVERVGEHRVRRPDVRIVAATNRDLQAEVRAGRFRADLFHRLSVYPLKVPPLREHLEDLRPLAEHFARKLAPRLQLASVALDDAFLAELAAHSWPGNVRELENTLERALVRARAGGNRAARLRRAEGLALSLEGAGTRPAPALLKSGTLRQATDRFQRGLIEQQLAQCDHSLARAAQRLGIDRSNLHRLKRRLGIK